MAQKSISSVEGSAFLVASAGNISDFEDAKAFFKQELKKAEQKAISKDQVIQIYRDAVNGFLLQELKAWPSTTDIRLAERVAVLTKECGNLSRQVCYLGLGLITLTGGTIAALIKLVSML